MSDWEKEMDAMDELIQEARTAGISPLYLDNYERWRCLVVMTQSRLWHKEIICGRVKVRWCEAHYKRSLLGRLWWHIFVL